MNLATLALVAFALAATGGLFLAVRYFRGSTLPMPVSLLHGLLAATGLVLLLVAYFAGGGGLGLPLLILVVAALGGFSSSRSTCGTGGRRPPRWWSTPSLRSRASSRCCS